jgi:oxygen-independent coproporphyrinogen III oxidase
MVPGKTIWKPIVQKAVTGRIRRFRMTPEKPHWPKRLSSPGLYLHVPFCKNLCPYCPYNRMEYEESLFAAYQQAVKREIDLYTPYLKGMPFTSLYIGGGTPTVNWSGLIAILEHLRRQLGGVNNICVELHPANMEDDCLLALKQSGVTMLSIGVESVSDRLLEIIGRNHNGKTAINAVERSLQIGFESVNVDLMFVLPGQSFAEWQSDVNTVVNLGVDQLSTYPMFSFPYSDLGKSKGIRQVERPASQVVKRMLRYTHDYCEERGLHRCAVWSWLKPGKNKFSSITRHHYIGFGPSAASMTGTEFYVNTFDVRAYADKLSTERPVALSMPVNRRIEMAYWLYWRIYELKILTSDFQSVFGADASLESTFGRLLRPLVLMGLLDQQTDGYRVTTSGAYWIHRLQNEYSLNYINRLWGTCRKTGWPLEVSL